MVGNKDFLQILKKKIFKKNYPACKELRFICKLLRLKLLLHLVKHLYHTKSSEKIDISLLTGKYINRINHGEQKGLVSKVGYNLNGYLKSVQEYT